MLGNYLCFFLFFFFFFFFCEGRFSVFLFLGFFGWEAGVCHYLFVSLFSSLVSIPMPPLSLSIFLYSVLFFSFSEFFGGAMYWQLFKLSSSL